MDDEKDFWDFLENITSEVVVEQMRREKIGADVVSLMTDEELSKYIPLHGERLRLRKYVRESSTTGGGGKRSSLLKVLREKIEARRNRVDNRTRNEAEEMRESNRRFGNRNAEKDVRRVELGWIHKSSGKSSQIRSRKGGGTRKFAVSKEASKEELLEEGKKLFFPNGVSSQGSIHDFVFDLCDYQERSVEEGKTVGQMYKDTKMPILRFYLASIERDDKQQQDEETDTESLPELHVPRRRPVNCEPSSPSEDILSEAMQIAGIETDFTEGGYLQGTDESTHSIVETYSTGDIHSPGDIHSTGDIHSMGDTQSIGDISTGDNDIVLGNSHSTPRKEHIIKLHRGQIMKEMIEAFSILDYPLRCIIKPQVIMPNGEMEAAEDAGGVTRDVLAEFWNSFYPECTLGSLHKVPCLRHDFGQLEWTSVAKIIAFGWETVRYFPVKISPVFMQYCMYGRFEDDILDEFLKYVPQNDSDILKAALKDVSSVDQTELDEIFTQHELKRVPRQANMERILREMAHKELIQAAMFVIDCWSPVLRELHLPLDKLLSLYKDLIPTPRRVLSLLKFPENMIEDEIATSHHLKRFIRELDPDLLTRFLRFCTGADLLTEKCIEISFVDVVGLARRPVAHTCSSMLELPKQYENFLKFRTEFISVLNSNIWIMDIV